MLALAFNQLEHTDLVAMEFAAQIDEVILEVRIAAHLGPGMACVGGVLGVQQFITSDFAVRSQVKPLTILTRLALADMLFQQLECALAATRHRKRGWAAWSSPSAMNKQCTGICSASDTASSTNCLVARLAAANPSSSGATQSKSMASCTSKVSPSA